MPNFDRGEKQAELPDADAQAIAGEIEQIHLRPGHEKNGGKGGKEETQRREKQRRRLAPRRP